MAKETRSEEDEEALQARDYDQVCPRLTSEKAQSIARTFGQIRTQKIHSKAGTWANGRSLIFVTPVRS